MLFGGVNFFILQPLSIVSLRQYHWNEANKQSQGRENVFHVFSSGIWIKQKTRDGYFLAHMDKIKNSPRVINKIFLHVLSSDSVLKATYHAQKAILLETGIKMKRGWVFTPENSLKTSFRKKMLPYHINLKTLFVQNFRPDLLYFWSLPRLISLAKKANLPAYAYELKWQGLWASVFECLGFTLFAAAVGLQLHRRYGSLWFFLLGCFAGFGFYFLSQMSKAFSLAGVISATVASWFPALLIMLTSLVLIFFLEEGHKKNY